MESADLEVSGLDVAAGKQRLLRAVTFRLPSGGGLLLRGRSGLGKTTLLRTIAGLHADPGEAVALAGHGARDTAGALGSPAWRRRVTYLHQRARLSPCTVEENLRAPFAYASATEKFSAERATEWLAELELPGFLERDARSLSVGEAQRVALVRGLLHRPSFALLDEPTSALDPESQECALAFLKARRGEGVGMLVVAHSAFGDLPALDLETFRA